jgi:hypothetical protein
MHGRYRDARLPSHALDSCARAGIFLTLTFS